MSSATRTNGHDAAAGAADEALKLTPLEEIKKKRPVDLPSGIVVLLGRGSLASLVKSGRIPNPLAASAWRYVEGSLTKHLKDKREKSETEETYLESMNELTDTVDAMVCAVLAHPRTVMTPEEEDDTSVWVGHFTEDDKESILRLATASLMTLETFRPGFQGEIDRPHRPAIRKIAKRNTPSS